VRRRIDPGSSERLTSAPSALAVSTVDRMGSVLPGVIAFVIAVWATLGRRGFALAVIRADVEDDRVPARVD
jgi:hypothetical protein